MWVCLGVWVGGWVVGWGGGVRKCKQNNFEHLANNLDQNSCQGVKLINISMENPHFFHPCNVCIDIITHIYNY